MSDCIELTSGSRNKSSVCFIRMFQLTARLPFYFSSKEILLIVRY